MKKSEVASVAKKLEASLKRKKYQPCGYVRGGEFTVYLNKKNELKFDNTNADVIEANGDKVVCLVAYYDTPDFEKECTFQNIYERLICCLAE